MTTTETTTSTRLAGQGNGAAFDPSRAQLHTPNTGIDLLPAAKVAGGMREREVWLSQMLEPEGMSPGASARAHARAFRFAEALMKQGYVVTEAPLGPRGGRRFTLDAYLGARAGIIYRLNRHRSCFGDHSVADCRCFDGLSDSELKLLATLARKMRWACRTDSLAALIRQHGEVTVRRAAQLYTVAGGRHGDPTIHQYVTLLQLHELPTLSTAVRLHAAVRAVDPAGSTVGGFLELLTNHEPRAVEVAVELFRKNGGSGAGQPELSELITAIDTSIT